MNFTDFIFYILTLAIMGAASLTVFIRRPVYALLSLILTFFLSTFLWVLLRAEFLGFLLLLFYSGVGIILFLFIVMMTSSDPLPFFKKGKTHLFWCMGVGGFFLASLSWFLLGKLKITLSHFEVLEKETSSNDIKTLSTILYQEYGLALQIIGIILLASLIGIIMLLSKNKSKALKQDIRTQIGLSSSTVELKNAPLHKGISKE